MKRRTIELTKQVRQALLALSDGVFMKTIEEWLDLADEHLECLDCSDLYRYALGYSVQSEETQRVYATFEALCEAEPENGLASWVVPSVEQVRAIINDFSIEQFYHKIISLAGEALADNVAREEWGAPPSSISDGYSFMRHLTAHLCNKVGAQNWRFTLA